MRKTTTSLYFTYIPPPDRERIAVSVSCVQHPLYLKTYVPPQVISIVGLEAPVLYLCEGQTLVDTSYQLRVHLLTIVPVYISITVYQYISITVDQ